MKKCVIILIACLLMMTLQGCSRSNNHGLDPDSPVKITMWHYYSSSQKNAYDKLVSEFNATAGKEQGIMVEAVSQGGVSDLETALVQAAKQEVGSAKMPDLFTAYASSALMMDELYGLADLKQYLSEEELYEYVDAYIEEGELSHNGELNLFPIAKATETLMINKTEWDLFAKDTGAATDDLKTWEGVARTAEAYARWSNGKAFFGRDAMANYILSGAAQLGHDLFSHDGRTVTFQPDQATMKRIYDCYYLPFIKGYYQKNGKYASDDIKTKDIIAQVGSTSSSAFFPSTITLDHGQTESISYMVLPVPNFADTKAMAVQQGAGVAIAKGEEKTEYACTVFLRWLTEADRNLNYAKETGYLPVKKGITTEQIENLTDIKPVVKDTMEVALKQIETSDLYTFEAFENSSEIRDYIETALTTYAVTDRTEIEQRLAQGESEEDVLSSYTDEEHFNEWYASFVNTINQLLQGGKGS